MEMAAVEADGGIVGEIGRGLLVLAGVARGDDASTAAAAATRLAELRIFADAEGRTNLSLADTGFAVLVVSSSRCSPTRKGAPAFVRRRRTAELAQPLVETLVEKLGEAGIPTASGRFGADMKIRCRLDGPFTITLEF
ncbi:MAG: D-aminoacyl-tRNA deacylase [Thermoanaerobaculia bacterium]